MALSKQHGRKQHGSNRYAEDPEYRKRKLEANSRYQATHRAEINARRRRRRATDPEYRAEINERKRRRWATDPEYRAKRKAERARIQRANLLKRFGMSWREYELRLALQNHACAICRKKPVRRLLCIDHCHKTGKVRGLLCTPCNAALGAFADDPRRMQAATDYLTAFYASLEPRGEVVASTAEQTEAREVGGLMREAILVELQCEPGAADDRAANKLRLIARKLVDKAAEGDMQAIKEVLARIDGKSVPAAGDAKQRPRPVSIRWQDPSPSAAAAGTLATALPPAGSGATVRPIC